MLSRAEVGARLAFAGSYSPDAVRASLSDLGRRLPDEATTLLKESYERGMFGRVLDKLVDGIAAPPVRRHIESKA